MSQAQRVITKFGGAGNVARALARLDDVSLHRNRIQVYRWTYPKAKGGTGGWIPSSILQAVLTAARLEGIIITPGDLYGGSHS